MTGHNFELKIDVIRNIPFALEAVFGIGIGIFLISKHFAETTPLIIGLVFIFIGTIQFIRNIKTFHLSDTELIIKRPLFPFAIGEVRFPISKVKEIKFSNVSKAGPTLNVVTSDRAGSFQIAATKEKIDEFELKFKSLGILPIRVNM